MTIAVVVLAAGGSTRMGESKQLLEFRGQTLVRRAVAAAIEAKLGPVIVVVGAEGVAVKAELQGLDATTVRNDRWADGMGTSIVVGVAQADGMSDVEAALIMLADQPLVDATILKRLADQWRRGGLDAAACMYGSTTGVPAVFSRSLFARLLALPAGGGAKHILADGGLKLATIDFPDGLADIDTPDDYERLKRGHDGT